MDPESGVLHIIKVILPVLIKKHMRVYRIFNQCALVFENTVGPVGQSYTDAAVYRVIQVKFVVLPIMKNIGSPYTLLR